jgi:hypothetical protein
MSVGQHEELPRVWKEGARPITTWQTDPPLFTGLIVPPQLCTGMTDLLSICSVNAPTARVPVVEIIFKLTDSPGRADESHI